ncbi:hypothetical protein LCGC14_1651110 [marine sediment metagenome]|uniref:Uncharacterized protein n=1 Tax=marine sediment metagenome TaxID=412755 RepID=A0A0F9KCK1_9ZZZZ
MTMPPDTDARLDAAITKVAETLSDGFDPSADVAVLIREAVEIAEAFGDLDGTEKKALALAFLGRVIDECFEAATPAIEEMVEALDLPGPEALERVLWDPLLKAVAPKLLKPALKAKPRLARATEQQERTALSHVAACMIAAVLVLFLTSCQSFPQAEASLEVTISANKGHMADERLPGEARTIALKNHDAMWKILFNIGGCEEDEIPADVRERQAARERKAAIARVRADGGN